MNQHEALRHKRNKELLERMKDKSDNLSSFDKFNSNWPSRPVIKKDPEAIKEIYGQETASL